MLVVSILVLLSGFVKTKCPHNTIANSEDKSEDKSEEGGPPSPVRESEKNSSKESEKNSTKESGKESGKGSEKGSDEKFKSYSDGCYWRKCWKYCNGSKYFCIHIYTKQRPSTFYSVTPGTIPYLCVLTT